MAQYRTGTVNIERGTAPNPSANPPVAEVKATVAGINTHWVGGTSGNVKPGDLFALVGDAAVHTIESISSDNVTLTLGSYWRGRTDNLNNADYIIARDFTPNHGLPLLAPGDDTAPFLYELARLIDGIVPATGPAPVNTVGTPGTSTYVHIRWADARPGVLNIDNSPTRKYFVYCVTGSATVPEDTSDMWNWIAISAKGDTGPVRPPVNGIGANLLSADHALTAGSVRRFTASTALSFRMDENKAYLVHVVGTGDGDTVDGFRPGFQGVVKVGDKTGMMNFLITNTGGIVYWHNLAFENPTTGNTIPRLWWNSTNTNSAQVQFAIRGIYEFGG